MKAISLWQPYASLIVTGAKTLETRSWATKYRGPLAIHAAKKWNSDLRTLINYRGVQGGLAPLVGEPLDLTFKSWPGVREEQLPRGVILAVCDLVDCIPTDHVTQDQLRHEGFYGNFTPGRFAWKLENVRPLKEPIPAKGRQGLWNWEGEGLIWKD